MRDFHFAHTIVPVSFSENISLPVHDPNQPALRPTAEIRSMAAAVQANLALLRRADLRRRGLRADEHDIRVCTPRRVDHLRETLIDPAIVAAYSDFELQLRLREIWGQYCAFCWLFELAPGPAVDFSRLADDAHLQCFTSVEIKLAEVHAFLWRFRYEQEIRNERKDEPAVSKEHVELARQIPARAFGKSAEDCKDTELLLAGCEHAGMLATLRWVSNPTLRWGATGIMNVGERPF